MWENNRLIDGQTKVESDLTKNLVSNLQQALLNKTQKKRDKIVNKNDKLFKIKK